MDLLLYLSKYSFSNKNVIAATLAWLSKEVGINFEVYYETSRSGEHYEGPASKEEDYFGSTILGGRHYEHFLLLKKFLNIQYALSGEHSTFRRLIDPNEVIVDAQGVSQFYKQIFSHFKRQIPSTAVIIGKSPELELDAFCYPEIYYRQALGLTSEVTENELLELKKLGVKTVLLLYLDTDKQDLFKSLGFEVKIIDSIPPSEDYRAVLPRITKRWINHAEGLMFGDPVLISYWIPWCCRKNYLSLFDARLENLPLKNIFSSKPLSKVMFGRHNDEKDLFHASKHDLCFQIVDPGRPVFPIMENVESRIYEPTKSLYDFEPSDAELEEFANQNKILCSLLFWCPDVRHAECLYQLLDLVTVSRAKVGVGITAHWYKYASQLLQLLYLSTEYGGVFPNVEPLLGSVGLGVASEASGYLNYETIASNLEKSRELMLETISEKSLPKGCYPFLDINYKTVTRPTVKPPFLFKRREPVNTDNKKFFDALRENNFEYVVSFKDAGKPKINFRKEDFVSLNYTAGQWTGVSPYIVVQNVSDLKKAEEKLLKSKQPGWILSAIDSPLWLYSKPVWKKGHDLFEIIQYLLNGGNSERLVNATPHTIARYAKILDNKKLLS